MSRRCLSSVLAVVMLLASPAAALAATPPTAYQQIVPVEGFESAYPARLAVTPVESADDSDTVAYWGRVTQRHSPAPGSAFGLWCAGKPVATSEDGWAKWSGKYPAATRGTALFSMPELADYYASRVDFAYTMPSLGTAEEQFGFIPAWSSSDTFVPVQSHDWIPLTASGAWSSIGWELSSPANDVNLSGRAGWMKFQFYDFTEDTPGTAEGVTIDDVSFTGLKYGPVRNLAAAVSGSSIVLTWQQPYKATTGTTVDARTKTFDVWRSVSGQNDWTRLSQAQSGTTYTDSTGTTGVVYDYKVQARDPIPGDRYGVLGSAISAGLGVPPSITVSVTASAASVTPGGVVTFTYRVRNSGTGTLTNVRLETGALFGSISRPDPLPQGAEWTVSRSKALSASVTAAATAYGTASGSVSGSTPGVTVTVTALPSRIAGPDRMATAVEVSKRAFPSAASLGQGKAIVVASAFGWADALPASSLAGAVGGPLLLVGTDSVAPSVKTEISRLKSYGVGTAYVVGGASAVGPGARSALRALGLTLVPVEGTDRYGTALAVSERTRQLRTTGATGGTAFVATGLNFPDALAASSLSAALKAPIVLTRPAALPAQAISALTALKPARIVVLGGPTTVASSVESQLKSRFPGAVVLRKSGPNRYDTAREIVTYGKSITGVTAPSGIFLATGTNYPDALAGGVLAGIGTGAWKPLMLTEPTRLSSQARSFMSATPSLGFASVLGGPSSVSENVRTAAIELAQ